MPIAPLHLCRDTGSRTSGATNTTGSSAAIFGHTGAATAAAIAAMSARDLLTLLSVYLSAIIHDFDHRGVNNQFLVRSGDPLALLYNDVSPMGECTVQHVRGRCAHG